MDVQEALEKKILWISLTANIGFVLLEFWMAVYSRSQSMLMDTAFDAAETVVIAISLILTPMLHKPVNEQHPFGYAPFESLFVVIKGFMLTAVTLSLMISNVQVMLSGGNHVDTTLVAVFETVLSLMCMPVMLALRHYGKKLRSPMIQAEIYGWKVDVAAGLGLSVAFLLPLALRGGPLAFAAPYFDQIVAVVLAALMLPEPIRLMVRALRELLLIAPGPAVMDGARATAEQVCADQELRLSFLDVVKTGRQTWVSVYILGGESKGELRVAQLREVYKELRVALRPLFSEFSLEVIPDFEEALEEKAR